MNKIIFTTYPVPICALHARIPAPYAGCAVPAPDGYQASLTGCYRKCERFWMYHSGHYHTAPFRGGKGTGG